VKLETLAQVNVERAARRPVIVVTDTANGDQRLVKAKDIPTDPLRAELAKQLRMGKSGMIEAGGKKLFLNVYAPTARLVIIGAVHISQALAPLARSLDYDVTVVDPRTAFASPERFPDVPLIAEWPDVALPPLNIDHYTAFVAVTLHLALQVVRDEVDRVLLVLRHLFGPQFRALEPQHGCRRDGVSGDVLVRYLKVEFREFRHLFGDLGESLLGVLGDLVGDLKVASLDVDLHGTPLSGSTVCEA